MERRAHFGRRTVPEPAARRAPVAPAAPRMHADAGLLRAEAAAADDDMEREIAAWNTARKQRRRALREPWRSVSIVAGIGFGLSSWLLPDSVANVAELVTLGLSIASFAAAWRKPPGSP